MIKFILMMKICSAVEGSCLPEYNAGVYNSWYDFASIGTINTLGALKEIGPDEINEKKLYVVFKCNTTTEA